ncbi:MAG: histidine--tRNA ligase [Lachnospiraceae bacterium]|nr:histidine--tRNA ligase [Lachnospiraceae bacterium]MBQ3980217.1 histidine--tRNA ligase [Lachnospiraceae bacterium]
MSNNKVQPRIMPGFMELLPEDQIAFNRMFDTIRRVYERYGFLPLDTATIELSEVLLAKAGGETEKQIYRFQKGDTDMALRFDLTVPLARYVAQHAGELAFPFKRYQMSKVFRGERPQKGRFREFYQCDIDVIGVDSLDIVYDAEMPAVIYNVFKELAFGAFTIRMNNRKVLNGFFSALGYADKIGDILRTIDKLEKIGREAVEKELGEFGVAEADIAKILSFLAIRGENDAVIEALRAQDVDNELYRAGVEELATVVSYLRRFGVEESAFIIDLTIARGLDYYTGTVFETMLNDYPSMGSICSGGRYDSLAGYYTDQKLPGIGISIGLTRLFYQLKENGLVPPSQASLARCLVIPMGEAQMDAALAAATTIRGAGIPADVYYQSKGMKQKMKYAAKIGVPYAAIIGEDEANAGTVMLKDMNTGEQRAVLVAELPDAVR